jgi:dTDP-L-rhamnose 4-epimerase
VSRKTVLITGGAGFIGSHVADALLAAGWRVRALDALVGQVHGADAARPDYLDPEVELIVGDLADPDARTRALRDVEAVVHLAAAVGVGQSMYEVTHYTRCNALATAALLEALARAPVERLVVASSMSIYGEGLYADAAGLPVEHARRRRAALAAGRWDPCGPDGAPLAPLPTPETKRPDLASVYALGKYDQERLCLMLGEAYGIPTTALRLFNVYGPRQALSNPYTGVLAIFGARLLNGRPPLVFEDGAQRRDFVSVHDVAQAFRLALEQPRSAGMEINIGSGESHTIAAIGTRMAQAVGRHSLSPRITGEYRVGDIRHCYADLARAREQLGFTPRVSLAHGLAELGEYLARCRAEDRTELARAELAARGLTFAGAAS